MVVGFGLCFRDSTGAFVIAKSAAISTALSVQEGEALALLEALELAVSLGFQKVLFEPDSKSIVDALSLPVCNVTELGNILARCKALLSTHTNFKLVFARRQINRIAHSLARASLSFTSPHIFYSAPMLLEHLILDEMK